MFYVCILLLCCPEHHILNESFYCLIVVLLEKSNSILQNYLSVFHPPNRVKHASWNNLCNLCFCFFRGASHIAYIRKVVRVYVHTHIRTYVRTSAHVVFYSKFWIPYSAFRILQNYLIRFDSLGFQLINPGSVLINADLFMETATSLGYSWSGQ